MDEIVSDMKSERRKCRIKIGELKRELERIFAEEAMGTRRKKALIQMFEEEKQQKEKMEEEEEEDEEVEEVEAEHLHFEDDYFYQTGMYIQKKVNMWGNGTQ